MYLFLRLRAYCRLSLIFGLVFLLSCAYRIGNIYEVRRGDTLFRLAHTQDVSIADLLAANPQLRSGELKAGQRILIPGNQLKADPMKEVVVKDESLKVASNEPVTVPEKKIVELPVESVPETPVKSTEISSAPAPEKAAPKIAMIPKAPSSPGFMWPIQGKILSNFGKRNEKMHNGIDIQGKPKQEVLAADDGTVVFQGNSVEGYGTMVILKHENNIYTIYAFLGETLTKMKEKISKAQPIARVSKDEKQSFFHFEIRSGKSALDPLKVLPKLKS